jgi:hypothetical protein
MMYGAQKSAHLAREVLKSTKMGSSAMHGRETRNHMFKRNESQTTSLFITVEKYLQALMLFY